MSRLVVASNNEHKIEEIKNILKKYSIEIVSMKEAGIDIDIEENGKTFMENAKIKAKALHDILKDDMILADDSGLMVEELGGAPGVYSARFAGEHGDSRKNNEKLLSLLQGVPYEKRDARFVCAMYLIINNDKVVQVQGEIEGKIVEEYKGQSGFGYDPLFFVLEYNKTFAEMASDEKNNISHRGRALEKLDKELKGIV